MDLKLNFNLIKLNYISRADRSTVDRLLCKQKAQGSNPCRSIYDFNYNSIEYYSVLCLYDIGVEWFWFLPYNGSSDVVIPRH